MVERGGGDRMKDRDKNTPEDLEKVIEHFKNIYLAHLDGKCDFYEGCLYCQWDLIPE